jgi:glycosyltransferase involved in cell wall biosynthesis
VRYTPLQRPACDPLLAAGAAVVISNLHLSVIVPTRDTSDLTLKCLAAVSRAAAAVRCEIVLVDDGSRDGTFDRVRSSFPDVRLVRHDATNGAFPESEKTAILRSLDVLIVPSAGLESFGLVAREAMEKGVPILASRRGALAEVVAEDNSGALFAPEDPADLVRQVRRVVDDPGLLDRWRRSLPAVKSVECHAEEIDEIYRALVKPRRR